MPQLEDAAGVATYYEETGDGRPVVVLHGGLESGADWSFLADALADRHRVYLPDRRGHGRTPDVDGPYTYRAMAAETIAFMEQVVDGPADLVGFSDGANVALLVAIERPDLVRSTVSISGNLTGEGLMPAMLDRLRDPDPGSPQIAPLRDAYAALSPDGVDHWPTYYTKVCEMGVAGPDISLDDVAGITCPTLVIVADDDVIDHHHSVAFFEALTDGRMAMVPGASHLVEYEHPAAVVALVEAFLDGPPPTRLLPMRAAELGE
ncbi:MAG: alpha/beta hydrolase [Actinomycetota bacterium]|nr:alpha/beta hydrolase [Actinomycetota bacterium]